MNAPTASEDLNLSCALLAGGQQRGFCVPDGTIAGSEPSFYNTFFVGSWPPVETQASGTAFGFGSIKRPRQAVVEAAEKLGASMCQEMAGSGAERDVPAWLNRGHVFLNTTRYESFGVSVVEAAACGLPLVVTGVGELPYLWKDGVDALLVPPDDAEAMAGAVRRVLKEPGLAEALSRHARAKAEGFDWLVVLPRWEELLVRVAQKERSPF